MNKVWRRIEKRTNESLLPDVVADKLCQAIQKDRTGIVRVGSRFQAVLAPLLCRLIPELGPSGEHLLLYEVEAKATSGRQDTSFDFKYWRRARCSSDRVSQVGSQDLRLGSRSAS